MKKTSWAPVLVTIALGASPSFAQMGGGPGAGAPMPMAVDFKKVPVGSWSEYAMAIAEMPPMKMKMALVARDGDTSKIETQVEGGMAAMMGGKMTMQIITKGDPSTADATSKLVMQIGDGDPMEMPSKGGADKRHFQGVDPKKVVGKEDIKTAAGTFKTEHFRDTSENGSIVDAWVSKQVFPVGLVKMTVTPAPGAAARPGGRGGPGGPVTFELTSVGKGAKATITKPAKPFDPAAMMGAMGGGRPGGGPAATTGASAPGKGKAGAAPAAVPAGAAPAAAPAAPAKKK